MERGFHFDLTHLEHPNATQVSFSDRRCLNVRLMTDPALAAAGKYNLCQRLYYGARFSGRRFRRSWL